MCGRSRGELFARPFQLVRCGIALFNGFKLGGERVDVGAASKYKDRRLVDGVAGKQTRLPMKMLE